MGKNARQHEFLSVNEYRADARFPFETARY